MKHDFLKSEHGTTAIEAAFILPFLCVLYFGMMALTSLITFTRKLTGTSATVSEAAAAAMATGAQRVLGADVALALTGVAGPSEQDGMPVGTLCVGLAIGADVHTRTFRMPGQRDQMRQMSVITALDWLRRTLAAAGGAAV